MKNQMSAILLAGIILLSGCSNTPNTVSQTGENENSQETTETSMSSEAASNDPATNPQAEDILLTAIDLLGTRDEEAQLFFNGGEENQSADGQMLIGRIYDVEAFSEETILYTSYRSDGLVNNIHFDLSQRSIEAYRSDIEKILGAPAEINDTPSESGTTYTMWKVDGKLIYLYKGYDYINVSLILPDDLQDETQNKTIAQGIQSVMAETEVYPELEQLIIEHYDLPDDMLAKTKYYYNFVDLNADGKEEIFVVIMGPYTSGSGGSSALIVYPVEDNLYINQAFTLIQTPIIISDRMTNGAKEIIAYKSGGGTESGYVRLTCSDAYYTSINDGEPIESLEGITGTAIIANDLIADMENNTFLTLGN